MYKYKHLSLDFLVCPGKEITIAILQSLNQVMIAKKLQISPLKHMRYA